MEHSQFQLKKILEAVGCMLSLAACGGAGANAALLTDPDLIETPAGQGEQFPRRISPPFA